MVVCDALEAADTTTTVRVDGGGRHITDGPFIETKEQLGGVIILEVSDLDDALQWAERTPWNARRLRDRDPPDHGLRGLRRAGRGGARGARRVLSEPSQRTPRTACSGSTSGGRSRR